MTTAETASAAQIHSSGVSRAVYRADIDGLRAVSVLAVILFHAGVPYLTGGFVGVDVFFVISGFLITRLLLENPARPLASQLKEFYVRRARRILPVLLVVIWVTALGAWLMYTPRALAEFGRFAAACAVMLANFGAWSAGGYFDTPWATTPLLHLWSIAVEEQFYLVFPFLLLLCQRKLPERWGVPVIATLAAASLALCIVASYLHPAANYYAAPTRAWELLLGALVALGVVPVITPRALAAALSALALGVILVAAFVFDSGTRYPGIQTIAPALATATLIATGRGDASAVNRFLALSPLVFIGLISYSLYLWHVPVFTLFAYFNVVPATVVQKIGLMALIGALAVASWVLIERPIRARRFLHGNATFAWLALACSAATLIGGIALARFEGFPRRFTPEVQRLVDDNRLFSRAGEACMGLVPGNIDAGKLCELGITAASRSMVLWGDSHAWALLPALNDIAQRSPARVYFAAWSACRPLTGVHSEYLSPKAQANCLAFNRAMTRAIQRLRPDVVVLHAYWNFGDAPGHSVVKRGLEATLREIHPAARAICIVHGTPVLDYSPPYAFAMTSLRGIDASFLRIPRTQAFAQQHSVDAGIRALAAGAHVRSFDPKEMLCDEEHCRIQAADGSPLFRDANHLSVPGALFIASGLEACVG